MIRQQIEFSDKNRLCHAGCSRCWSVLIAPRSLWKIFFWGGGLFMAWAVQAIRNDDRRNAYVALALTVLMGAAVINQMVFAIGDFGLPIDRSVPALMLFVIYGSYIVYVAIAIIFVLLMTVRALAGNFNSKNADGIEAAAIYWYSTIIVYLPVWYLITITK